MDTTEDAPQNTRSTFPLPRLPDVVLEMVVSNLNAEETLRLLTGCPSLVYRRFPITCLDMRPNLDSIRLCMVALPNSVKEITCIGTTVISAGFLNIMRDACWSGLLSSTSLEKLTTDDVGIISGIHLSTSLTTLKIEEKILASPPIRGMSMEGIHMPHSVTTLCLDVEYRAFFPSLSPYEFSPRNGNFFFDISRHFPSVTSLTMRPCPCKEFWDSFDDRYFEKIAHLSLKMTNGSYFPLSRTKKLETLVFSGIMEVFVKMMRGVTLSSLTAFEYEFNQSFPVSSISGTLLTAAPNVKYLSLHFAHFLESGRVSSMDMDFLQRFDYFRVRHFHLTIFHNLPFLLQLIPRVKCFDVFSDVKVRADEFNVMHVDDDAIFSLQSEVIEAGGSVEISHLHRVPRVSPFGGLLSRCRVRVICDQQFNFESVLRDHPLLFRHE